MNAELTKRMFQAVASASDPELMQICRRVIQDEKDKGHTKLADQLETILAKRRLRAAPTRSSTSSTTQKIGRLPLSRRYQDPLVTVTPREKARHHMVLAPDVEELFAQVEKEYAAKARLAKHGLPYRRKILFYGPPGCGKTLGAERLAWNTGLPLVTVRFDALLSSHLGESAANLRSVFNTAQEEPCVLLLDECDSIARSRTDSNDVGEISRLVNTLLTLLDDYTGPGLLVAATNLDTRLDKALFRRFDSTIRVPPPTLPEIHNLVVWSLGTLSVARDVDITALSKNLLGLSAANIVKVVQNAAKKAVLTSSEKVFDSDFQKSLEEIYEGEWSQPY